MVEDAPEAAAAAAALRLRLRLAGCGAQQGHAIASIVRTSAASAPPLVRPKGRGAARAHVCARCLPRHASQPAAAPAAAAAAAAAASTAAAA
eukprot:scaffold107513_cov45-Phaeocystis_antarctica.AAC.1